MVPRFCHDRTSPVSLVLSPVTRIACFLSIQFTHENKCMHGCRYALNGTEATLDGSQCLDFTYGWSYVNTPGMQRRGKQR